MRFAGNVIWFIFGGWATALFWLLGAAIFAISIIGLPLTRAAIEMAKLSAWPFGREVVHVRELDDRDLDATTALTGTIGFVANLIWALTFGLVLCLSYIALGILYCITLIGIPFGLQAFKLAGISLWPVGRRVVTAEMADIARRRNASDDLDRMRSHGKGRRHRQEPAVAGAGEAPTIRREPALLAASPGTEAPRRTGRPPLLATDRGWFVEVVGEASYQDTLAEADANAKDYEDLRIVLVTLEPEDDNPRDENAVRVDTVFGTVGYLSRAAAREYRGAIGARAASASGAIHRDTETENAYFGIWLNAEWPPRFK